MLKLEITADLRTIVQEFSATPTISLVGEAIEARAWIEDGRRNRKQQPMTPAFFRRWLKRERGDYGTPPPSSFAPKGTRPGEKRLLAPPLASSQPSPDPYRAYVQQRAAEVWETTERKAVGS